MDDQGDAGKAGDKCEYDGEWDWTYPSETRHGRRRQARPGRRGQQASADGWACPDENPYDQWVDTMTLTWRQFTENLACNPYHRVSWEMRNLLGRFHWELPAGKI